MNNIFNRHEFELYGLGEIVRIEPRVMVKEAVGYLDFVRLVSSAALVLTDSGGVQQEACIFQVPCLTMIGRTTWDETVAAGCNMVTGTDPDRIVAGVRTMLEFKGPWPELFGDGSAFCTH